MRRLAIATCLALTTSLTTSLAISVALAADNDRPDWAYAVPPPPPPKPANAPAAPAPDPTLYSLPGSKLKFTENKIQGVAEDGSGARVAPGDWFPDEHPPMPPIVEAGDPGRNILACSQCHSVLGRGRSESAGVSGLPRSYFVDQMHDMAAGLRQSAEPRKGNVKVMAAIAKAMTEEEIQASADYYTAIPWPQAWIKVVEATTVPKTKSILGMWSPLEGAEAGTEPLGERIIEVPADPKATEFYRDPHSGFIAYVPVGALADGKRLVTTGGGKTTACALCHGAGLGGVGAVPGIAGRSPSYLTRQLYDIQQGARHGAGDAVMKALVDNLSTHDIMDIAAYVASLPAPKAK